MSAGPEDRRCDECGATLEDTDDNLCEDCQADADDDAGED